MIEAHLSRVFAVKKACAGVAAEKGLGAEEFLLRKEILATRIISVLLSHFAECYLFDVNLTRVAVQTAIFVEIRRSGGTASAFLLLNTYKLSEDT